MEQIPAKTHITEFSIKREIKEEIMIKEDLDGDCNLFESENQNNLEIHNIKNEETEDEFGPSTDSIAFETLLVHPLIPYSEKIISEPTFDAKIKEEISETDDYSIETGNYEEMGEQTPPQFEMAECHVDSEINEEIVTKENLNGNFKPFENKIQNNLKISNIKHEEQEGEDTPSDDSNESEFNEKGCEHKIDVHFSEPSEADHISRHRVPQFDECKTSEKNCANIKIIIPHSFWEKFYVHRKSLLKGWTDEMNLHFSKHFPECVLKFLWHKCYFQTRKSVKFYFNAKAQCKHTGCAAFKFFTVENINSGVDIEMCVEVIGEIKHTTEKHRRFIRGEERKILAKRLLLETPSIVKYQQLSAADQSKLKAGNLNHLPSLSTLKKISSEKNSMWRLRQNDFTDLIE